MKSGTATSQAHTPVRSTDSAHPAPTNRITAIASTRTNYSSTPTPKNWSANGAGPTRCSVTACIRTGSTCQWIDAPQPPPSPKKLVGQWRWSAALFGSRVHSNRLDLSMDRRDSAPATPKCVVTDDAFDWSRDTRPNVPWGETVIYETHVRGTSMLRNDIRQHERGSFAGFSSPWFMAH